MKADQVKSLLESGRKLPLLMTYKERLERLRDSDYLLSADHQEQLWVLSDLHAPDAVTMFVRRFIDVATRHRIPVYCRGVWRDTCELVHAQYEDVLGDEDWYIFGQIGDEVVSTTDLKARWAAVDGGSPAVWFVDTNTQVYRRRNVPAGVSSH